MFRGTPYPTPLQRWMVFIDGENLTKQAAVLCEERRLPLLTGEFYDKDHYVWWPELSANQVLSYTIDPAQKSVIQGIRTHYYTSVRGDGDRINAAREAIFEWGCDPTVFHQPKGRSSKGVDIAMATDALTHAVDGNFDACVLIAGDGDYVPLVEEIKRRGKAVVLAFFEGTGALNPRLRLASDRFAPLDEQFLRSWRDYALLEEPSRQGELIGTTHGRIKVRIMASRDGTMRFVHFIAENRQSFRLDLPGTSEGHAVPNQHALFKQAEPWNPLVPPKDWEKLTR